jgi:hypothetical protein
MIGPVIIRSEKFISDQTTSYIPSDKSTLLDSTVTEIIIYYELSDRILLHGWISWPCYQVDPRFLKQIAHNVRLTPLQGEIGTVESTIFIKYTNGQTVVAQYHPGVKGTSDYIHPDTPYNTNITLPDAAQSNVYPVFKPFIVM